MFLITSCASQNFYQIHKVEPISNVLPDGKYLVYDDENCKVFYNFWEENGDAGFKIYNKTDSILYLNMEESFFIINGIANDYFKNRVFTESRSSQKTTGRQISANRSAIYDGYGMVQVSNFLAGRSTETSTTNGRSLSITEPRLISVPAKTSKVIYEYSISGNTYRSNELFRFPTRSQVKTEKFTVNNSPVVFSNRISYYIGSSNKLTVFVNEFFVSEITNYPAFNANTSTSEIYQETAPTTTEPPLKLVSPDKYYIKYEKARNSSKH